VFSLKRTDKNNTRYKTNEGKKKEEIEKKGRKRDHKRIKNFLLKCRFSGLENVH